MFLEQTADVASPEHHRDLVAEANHRIANSLSIISALVRQRATEVRRADTDLTPKEVAGLLGEIQARLDATGRLHRMLSSATAGDPVDVGIYLQQLVSELVPSLTRKDAVILHSGCELGCRLPADATLHLGLIAVEFVVNSVKHAHPAGVQGHIALKCHYNDNCVVVDLADDGVGLPEGLDPAMDSNSGLKLMRSLARQIGAGLEFRNSGLGFQCIVTLPRTPFLWPG